MSEVVSVLKLFIDTNDTVFTLGEKVYTWE